MKWAAFSTDELPLWVADMDCAPPICVKDTINASLSHGIFGYGLEPPGFRQSWVNHLSTRHDWRIDPDWIIPIPGVVPGMRFSLMAHPEIKHVLTPTPSYPYFRTVPAIEERIEHTIKLDRQGQSLEPDLAEIQTILNSINEQAAILWCNPHNPGGTVYSDNFLSKLATMAAENNALIISDEIWADLILDDATHVPMGKISSPDQPTITLMAATKTFNIAGFACAVAIIPEPKTRARFEKTQIAMPHITPLAYSVTEACLNEGWDWHQALLEALCYNRSIVESWAVQHPELEITTGQASFLAWIESESDHDLTGRLSRAGVRLSPGASFGSDTATRLNFGCAPAILEKALRRINLAL